jgi:hypothetical protein
MPRSFGNRLLLGIRDEPRNTPEPALGVLLGS